MDIDEVNDLKVMKEMADRHCSHCAFYDLLPNYTMYCGKLKKRITARKKPCKHYTIYTAVGLILKYLKMDEEEWLDIPYDILLSDYPKEDIYSPSVDTEIKEDMEIEDIQKYGYDIDVDEYTNFYPFRYPNTIVTSVVYLIHPNGKREYIGEITDAYYDDTSDLEDEAIRRVQKYIGNK